MQPITPLTNDYNALKDKIEALNANGYTNILEGVSWGMRVLSPGEPFARARRKAGARQDHGRADRRLQYFRQQAERARLDLFEHGLSGRRPRRRDAAGASSTTTLMNVKTLEACANAKADGIEVYTIRLEEPNVATGTMLKECASSPDHYFDVPRAQLDDAFAKIKDRIVRVRIAS